MSTISIYHHKRDKLIYDFYIHEIERMGDKKLCASEITHEFLMETLDDCEYLFIHLFHSEIRGFACVTYHSKPTKHLYIDLICNTKFHPMRSRATEKSVRMSGKDIIHSIIQLGRQLKARTIKLSAIQNVISYYHHLGFTFDSPELRHTSKSGLILDLNSALEKKDDRLVEKIVDKIVSRYYPDFYNENNQIKYAREGSNTKKEAMSYGIPMVYQYPKEAAKSRCKGRSVKNPNNCDKYDIGCSVARGTNRTYCRRSTNTRTLKNRETR